MELGVTPGGGDRLGEAKRTPGQKGMLLGGLERGVVRIPLTEMTAENAAKLEKLLPSFV